MKAFVRTILIFFSPFIIAILFYVVSDPWKVLWKYDDYTDITVNAAFRSYRLLTRGDTILYNSFIVGSSRSQIWPISEWEKVLHDSTAVGFHLDQSADGICGALERMRWVYAHVDNVKHILLIADESFFSQTAPQSGAQFITPWQMTGERDFIKFHLACMKFFFSRQGQELYWGLGSTRQLLPYFIDERNEAHMVGKEWAINEDPSYYYEHCVQGEDMKFYKRDSVETVGESVLKDTQIKMLNELYLLFKSHRTEYKIVVSPLYDQIKLNPYDTKILYGIFGEENVFDYSGINKFTQDTLNYYETSHYRPNVCIQIMNEIYK